jgi:hypothetical protein
VAQNLHVMRTADADWVVHRPCRDQVLSRHDSERSAVAAARQQLISVGGGELVIHGDDGRVALVIRYARPARRADVSRLDQVPGGGSRALRRWG